jgi:hypothetical protein
MSIPADYMNQLIKFKLIVYKTNEKFVKIVCIILKIYTEQKYNNSYNNYLLEITVD